MSVPKSSLTQVANVALAASLVAACGCSAEPLTPRPQATAAASGPTAPSAQVGPAPPALATICAEAPCAGPLARVELWRDASGAIGRLYFHGDISRCSHPPSVYFDATGRQLAVVANRPVAAGSAEAEHFAALHADQRAGLQQAGSVSCAGLLPGGPNGAPP